jgi:hypothetical protein
MRICITSQDEFVGVSRWIESITVAGHYESEPQESYVAGQRL